MHKKYLLYLFLIFVAVLLFGGVYYISSTRSGSVSFTDMCLKEKEYSSVCTQVLVDKGILDFSACLNIENEKMRDACYSYAARNKGDDAICEKINDAECLAYCKIIVKKDPSQCNNLVSVGTRGDYWANKCYEEIAKTTINLLLCDKFKDTYRFVDCYQAVASYNNDIKICDKLESRGQAKQCNAQYLNYKESY